MPCPRLVAPALLLGAIILLGGVGLADGAAKRHSQAGGLHVATGAPRERISAPNSADRVIFWIPCLQLAKLSDAQLDEWRGKGVGGFICIAGYLRGLGGSQDFSGDPDASLEGERFELQRRLASSRIGARTRALGMKLYLGLYVGNRAERIGTPFLPWEDGAAWADRVLPRVRELAGAARQLGFAGLALDQELYASLGPQATWEWNYSGHRGLEAEVRGQVVERGRELMRAMLKGFPGLELIAHQTDLPGGWKARVEKARTGNPNPFGDDVRIDLWDGLSSVPGYAAIRWIDATFYKTTRLPGVGWDEALRYNATDLYSLLSRRFSNWSYASTRLHISPFAWIDRGPDSDEGERSPAEVAEQLAAFRRWGTGGEFANFAFAGLDGFDYRPYLPGLRSASASGTVDPKPPWLQVSARLRRRSLTLHGLAGDNLAIRAVRWRDSGGRSGTATLVLRRGEGDRPGSVEWSIPDLAFRRPPFSVTVTAEDLKGGEVTRTVRVATRRP